ncbi:50S ribosomal protein L11 methyltransferase [Prolixibacteraceae bacterium JC049]|nr:50S ribosomal protein L11 methyltransferase [Prolixibacteraceae bacterium JC049]
MQLEILITDITEALGEVMVAELSLQGFESFWESEEGLRGYIEEDVFDEAKMLELKKQYGIHYQLQNVNSASWDVALNDHFQSIEISENCIVRSSQTTETNHKYQLVVDPKLAFGSGEHPSTWLCLKMQLEMDHFNKKVVDIGTGSGILAIMAEKCGAAEIDAFDNNPWAIEIMQETLQLNASKKINVMAGEQDDINLQAPYNLALGNLNASVLLEYLPQFIELVENGGQMLLSGYMEKDKDAIHELAANSGLSLLKESEKDNWIAALFEKR